MRIEPIPEPLRPHRRAGRDPAPKLAAVCVDVALAAALVAWLRGRGFEIVEVSGRGRVHARRQRDLARRRAGALEAGADAPQRALRARGLEVFDPDLEMFTLGGGGAHCLAQALRRERLGWR